MKRIFRIFSLVALCAAATSCNDWLDDVKQTTNVDDAAVFEEESSIDSYVFGFYTYLDKYGSLNTSNLQFGGSLTESLTDVLKYGATALGARGGHPYAVATDYNYITPEISPYGCWSSAYEQIRRINQFIDLLHTYSSFDDTKNLRWEAEARFFRAFVYFQLAKRHTEGVILYDALPEGPNKARASKEDTWNFIINDLKFAANTLPDSWASSGKGRITSGGAWAMLSRVALYAERWQLAYDAALEVERKGIYDLVGQYAKSWKGNNVESIIEFAYNTANPKDGPSTQFDAYYVPACDGSTYGGCGTPTQELVESYEKAGGGEIDWSPWHRTTTTPPPYAQLEPRFQATVIYPGSIWKGHVMDNSVGGTYGEFMNFGDDAYANGRTTTGYFLKKLLDESNTDPTNRNSTQTWVEIRFAEVLLNKAEAAYRLNLIADAQEALNRVRNRVGLPAKNSTGEQFFNDYRRERKLELVMEGHLFWDMRRWQLAHVEYNNFRMHGIKISGGTYEYVEVDMADRVFNPRTYCLPIPATELKDNALLEQFDDWK